MEMVYTAFTGVYTAFTEELKFKINANLVNRILP